MDAEDPIKWDKKDNKGAETSNCSRKGASDVDVKALIISVLHYHQRTIGEKQILAFVY